MKFLDIKFAFGAAIAVMLVHCDAKHGFGSSRLEILEKRHSHKNHASPRAEASGDVVQKRGHCTFPTNAGLVAVTPGSINAGWAMSPDQACTPGSYCPYACPPGEVMAQWSPLATAYEFPLSMDGGLYCDSNGEISKPFPNEPYCVSGTGTVAVVNECGGKVPFCQTVLPGNEAMLIPTEVDESSKISVPGISYWLSTASHFYVSAPGISTTDACIWGDESQATGNWAPYVMGANTDANGETFVKIGYNPIWTGSSLSSTMPTFGIKIECPGSDCINTCSIDPSTDGIGKVSSPIQASGAGGASFCVVTVPSGSTANIVVFENGDSSSSGSVSSSKAAPSSTTTLSSSSQSATPTPTSSSIISITSSSSSSSTPKASTISYSSTSISTSSVSLVTSSSFVPLTSQQPSSTSTLYSLTSSAVTKSAYATTSNAAHILLQNGTSVSATGNTFAVSATKVATGSPILAASGGAATSASKKQSVAATNQVSNSVFGLVLLLAIACFT